MDFLGAHLKFLHDLAVDPTAVSLNLHLNDLTSTDGLQQCTHLEELILSANAITSVRGLENMRRLRVLDLSSNDLSRITGLSGLVALKHLHLAYNRIATLEGLQQLWGRDYGLRVLDIRHNSVQDASQMMYLGGCTSLSQLYIADQIIADGLEADNLFQSAALTAAPWLEFVDGVRAVFRERRKDAEEHVQASTLSLHGGRGANSNITCGMTELSNCLTIVLDALASRAPGKNRINELCHEISSEIRILQNQQELVAVAPTSDDGLHAHTRVLKAEARIALKCEKQQEEHASMEQELSRTETAVASVTRDQTRVAEVLAEERSLVRSVEAHLAQERAEATVEQAALRRLQSVVARTQEGRSARVINIPALSEDLRLTEQACAQAYERCSERERIVLRLRDVINEIGDQVNSERSAVVRLSSERHALRAEIYDCQRCVAFDAGLLASLVTEKHREQELCESEMVRAETLQRSLSLHRETARASEVAAAALVSTRPLQLLQEELESEERALQLLEAARSRRRDDFIGKLQTTLSGAEVVLREAQTRCRAVDGHLQHYQVAGEMADVQRRFGMEVVEKLKAKLEEGLSRECSERHEETCLNDALCRTECSTAHYERASQKWRQEAVEVRREISEECVSTSLHEEYLQECRTEQDKVRDAVRSADVAQGDLDARMIDLANKREELKSMQKAFGKTEVQEQEVEINISLKKQMVADARRQISDLEAASRAAESEQKHLDRSWHRRLEDAAVRAQDMRARCSELKSSCALIGGELDQLERSVCEKVEVSDIAQHQIHQLHVLYERQEQQASEQVQHLRGESRKVLRQAQEAMSQIERQFRLERAGQLLQIESFQQEHRGLSQECQTVPQQVVLLGRRISAERARKAQSVAALARLTC